MSTNWGAVDSNSDAVVSFEPRSNSNITASNGVEVGVGLLESKIETLMEEPDYNHHEGDIVGGVSIDDARVSGDEKGILMEALKFNENRVSDEEKEGEYKVFDDARVSGDQKEILMESVEKSLKFNEDGVNDEQKEGEYKVFHDARVSGDEKGILMESVEKSLKFNENGVNDEEKEGEYKVCDDARVSGDENVISMEPVEEVLIFSENGVNDEDKEGKVFDDAMVSGDEKGSIMESVEKTLKFNENGINDEEKEGEYKVFDDASVSGDEKGISMEPVEEVLKFSENGVNDEDKDGKVFDDAMVSEDEKGSLMESVEKTLKFNENGVNDEEKEGEYNEFDDARVSGDEKGISMEPVEEVSKFNENGVNDEDKEGKVFDDAMVSGDEKGSLMESVEKTLKFNENGVNDGEKEGEYKVVDLVWAKVKSYPWWPGLIFDPSASTKKARKHFKKDGFLIAYFGDQTFAWNEASKIKPFRMNFCKMVTQSNTKSFCNAVDCALDEAARRVEFGLACSCLSEKVYAKIKSQDFVNAGIRKESSRIDGGDNFSTVASFKPANVVQSVQDLAKEHFVGISRLEALTVRAQLLAFYRWKGYYQLDRDKVLDGSESKFEDNSKLPLMGDKKVDEDAKPASLSERFLSKKRKLKASDSGSSPSKKKRCLKDLTPNVSSSVSNGENKSKKSGSKRTVLESDGSREETHNGAADSKSSDSSRKKLFRVGDSICRIARQLSESPLILKKDCQRLKMPLVYPTTDEILSQICLAAISPMEEKHTLNPLVTFCFDFRNYLLAKNSESREKNSTDMMGVDQTEENAHQSEATEAAGLNSSPKTSKENSATALILKFTNLDSVPSVMNLNEIFSQYGPLREMETEVLKKNNCAKVVFERRSNAETAFSSAGKFSIFGPSLISYRLDYSPVPRKTATPGRKQSRKE